jgi:hypothetical protein
MPDFFLSEFEEEGLPNNTYYGDGSRIEPEVMDHLRHAYLREKVVFPWQQFDVLNGRQHAGLARARAVQRRTQNRYRHGGSDLWKDCLA